MTAVFPTGAVPAPSALVPCAINPNAVNDYTAESNEILQQCDKGTREHDCNITELDLKLFFGEIEQRSDYVFGYELHPCCHHVNLSVSRQFAPCHMDWLLHPAAFGMC